MPSSSVKALFTPGPLTTSRTVKEAMLQDVGSRDFFFIDTVKEIRNSLLSLAGVSQQSGYEAVLMQGSGTFAIESVVSSLFKPNDRLLVLVNGAYGHRLVSIAKIHGVQTEVLEFEENQPVSLERVTAFLENHPHITHVACIHCETTTGIINPLVELGTLLAQQGILFLVDAMSSFGGIPLNMKEACIDFLISSSNKCIEGVPGFAFVICNRTILQQCAGNARTIVLDLEAQWQGLEVNGQFRFTPPTLSIMAFHQALKELEEEGGITERNKRYRNNKRIIDEGLLAIGFRHYLPLEFQGPIITSYLYPSDEKFDFEYFYNALSLQQLVIYPGKLSRERAFRIGHIGHLFESDMHRLVKAVEVVVKEKGWVVG
jgi:2-aminoethylphosphonate-pyruvate transaminase